MPSKTIGQLIVNSPYEEPSKHWRYDRTTRLFDLVEGRRPAGYVIASEDSRSFDDPGIFVEIPLVNRIRPRVRAWREAGYPGATGITRRLLAYWNDPEEFESRRFFFCQIEAVETLIWLMEAPAADKVGIDIPSDGGDFKRLCAKMATGSGKTIVMAMVIAWQTLNKIACPRDSRFARNFLVVAPGLTVKSRLAVLEPSDPDNYYEAFRIVPTAVLDKLRRGKVIVRNWHTLNWETEEKVSRKRSVDKRGAKSNEAYIREMLGEMATARDILVINDEAHHAWRVPLATKFRGVSKRQLNEATKWIGGLDRIHRARGILVCYDFSATPFMPSGGKSSQEALFDWIVSDFGLNDAIEAGLVKTPRVVVRDDALPDARSYRSRLYHIYNDPEVKDDLNRRAKPQEPLPDLVLNAYNLLGFDWREWARKWEADGAEAPPTMITVANRTETAARVKYAFDSGRIQIKELCNPERTLHIDSKVLGTAEEAEEPIAEIGAIEKAKRGLRLTVKQRAELLRRQVDTVGRAGQPGGRIQNVISVGMLSEGWDAHTVTHIMGLRAFSSQLLCEQVVGRGLRRTTYDVEPDGRFKPEHVNVFGVPFTFLPHESDTKTVPPPSTPKTEIKPVLEKASFEIRWPNVIRIDHLYDPRLTLDSDWVEELELDASQTPQIAELAPIIDGKPDMSQLRSIDLERLAHEFRTQRIVFETARDVYEGIETDWEGSREILLAQLVRLVNQFVHSDKIIVTPSLFAGNQLRWRLLLALNMTKLVQHIWQAIRFQNTEKLVPIFDSDHPIRTTGDMAAWYTTKPCEHVERSHINLCVYDSTWEASEAFVLDHSKLVDAWVKNDHLGFEVFYIHRGIVRKYRPDFLVRLKSGDMMVLEVKGRDTARERTKRRFLHQWTMAVNEHGGFGRWFWGVSKSPGDIHDILAARGLAGGSEGSQRLGFMAGQIDVPDDFDNMGRPEIERMFQEPE